MRTKYLLKLKKKFVGTILNIIFFIKEYFSSDSFTLTITWRTTMTFSWFRRSIEGHKWLTLEWTHWMAKNSCNSSFVVYRTCKEIWWGFFFCCEASFSVWSRFWIFFSRFSFLDFFYFWIPPSLLLKENTSIYRWRQGIWISNSWILVASFKGFSSLILANFLIPRGFTNKILIIIIIFLLLLLSFL